MSSLTLRPHRPIPRSTVRVVLLVRANMQRYFKHRLLFVTGFLEPFLFLLSIGIGVGGLVGGIHVEGETIPYAIFVAPGLMATSAMNGAMIDSIFNVYFKLRISHSYDAVLATPMSPTDLALGEIGWSIVRVGIYSVAFLIVMAGLGDVHSWMVIFCLPAAMLVSASFSAVGIAATTYMRTWQDFDLVMMIQMPMFLFSGVFFPLTVYPGWLQLVVSLTPLYQGVALCRDFALGHLHLWMLFNVAYLLIMGAIGLRITIRRLAILLLP